MPSTFRGRPESVASIVRTKTGVKKRWIILQKCGKLSPTLSQEVAMPQERLSMRKNSEVLRLKKACNLSNRAIARSCQISHTTAGEYLKRAEAAGLSWPLPEELDEEKLGRLLYPAVVAGGGGTRKPMPDWKEGPGELKKRSVP